MKDCSPVSLNRALVRLNITPVSLDITKVSQNNSPVAMFMVIGLKGGNKEIIQLKNLCSAVCILHSVCTMQTNFYLLFCSLPTE